jgi:hypothetical protein
MYLFPLLAWILKETSKLAVAVAPLTSMLLMTVLKLYGVHCALSLLTNPIVSKGIKRSKTFFIIKEFRV